MDNAGRTDATDVPETHRAALNALAFLRAGLIVVLPVLVLFSGMAMTPFLVLLALLLLASAMAQGWRGPRWAALGPDGRALVLILALFLVWPTLSVAWSITPAISLGFALKTDALCLAGLAAVLAASAAPLPVSPALSARTATGMFAAIAVCTLIVLQEQLPHGGLLTRLYTADGFDKFFHKNINRGLCALAVFVWPAALMLRRANRPRLAEALPWVLAPAIAVMHSLSAKMALIFGLGVFYAVRRWPRRIAPVIAVGVPLLMAAWPVVFERLYGPFFTAPEIYRHLPDSSQARIDIWNFVTARIAEKPVLGWGIETARSMPGGTDEYMPGRTHLPLHPHNSVLNVLLEEGLVGFLLSLGGLFVVFHTWRRTGRDDPARLASAGAAIVAYLAVGFTAFGVWQTWWIACAWIAAVLFRRVAEPHAPLSSRP